MLRFTKDYVAALSSVGILTLIHQPFDYCKMLLQEKPNLYRNRLDVFRKIPKRQILFNWLKNTVFSRASLRFPMDDLLWNEITKKGVNSDVGYLLTGFLSGGLAGALSSPLYAVTSLVNRVSNMNTQNIFPYFRREVSSNFNLLLPFSYNSIYLGGYNALKKLFLTDESGLYEKFLASLASTISAEVLTYPFFAIQKFGTRDW